MLSLQLPRYKRQEGFKNVWKLFNRLTPTSSWDYGSQWLRSMPTRVFVYWPLTDAYMIPFDHSIPQASRSCFLSSFRFFFVFFFCKTKTGVRWLEGWILLLEAILNLGLGGPWIRCPMKSPPEKKKRSNILFVRLGFFIYLWFSSDYFGRTGFVSRFRWPHLSSWDPLKHRI